VQKKKIQIQNNKRRLSLPHSIESATVANEKKAQRRLSGRLSLKVGARRNSLANSSAAASAAAANDNVDSTIQRATPYAQVVLERGGTMSPPLTRSATKKKKKPRLDDHLPPRHHDNGSPDHDLDADADAHDPDETTTLQQQQQRERERASGAGGGLLMMFSPPNHVENKRRERENLARQEAERYVDKYLYKKRMNATSSTCCTLFFLSGVLSG
jgi:cell division septum initiation protein DivIVA